MFVIGVGGGSISVVTGVVLSVFSTATSEMLICSDAADAERFLFALILDA